MNPCFTNADEWINWSNNANVTSLRGLMCQSIQHRDALLFISLFFICVQMFCYVWKRKRDFFMCLYLYFCFFLVTLFIYYVLICADLKLRDKRRKMNAVAGQKEVSARPDIWYFSGTCVRYRTDPCSDTRTNAVFYCTVAPSHWWTDVLDSGRGGRWVSTDIFNIWFRVFLSRWFMNTMWLILELLFTHWENKRIHRGILGRTFTVFFNVKIGRYFCVSIIKHLWLSNVFCASW